ncbi:MAG: hypothetical protein KJ737_01125 [Proteobacteria bacterium]|nr:hypothetical protein [Pseudomonadota bacterium]
MQFFRSDKIRFGAGISYHISPSINGSGFASDADFDFDNALGFVFEVDYLFSTVSVGGRYSMIEYSGDYTKDIDGSSFDLIVSVRF